VECDWKAEPFARLQALPKDCTPITQPDGALNADLVHKVIEGLRLALIGILEKRGCIYFWRYDYSWLHGSHAADEVEEHLVARSLSLLQPTPGDRPEKQVTRVYFSGGIDLRHV
jgi:hypothetical protein